MIRLTRLQKVQEKKRFYRCWNDVIMAFSNIRTQERYQAVSDCPSNAFVRPFLLHCNKYELYLSLVTLAVQSTTLSVVSKRMSSPGVDITLRDIGTCRTLTLHYNLQSTVVTTTRFCIRFASSIHFQKEITITLFVFDTSPETFYGPHFFEVHRLPSMFIFNPALHQINP